MQISCPLKAVVIILLRFPIKVKILSPLTYCTVVGMCNPSSFQVWDNEAFALKTAVENFELGDNGGEDVKPSYHVALGSDNSWYLFTEKWIRTVYRTGFPNAALTLADALPREIMAELLDKAEMQWQKLAVSELGGLWCMEGSLETWSWSLNVPVLSSLSEDDEVPCQSTSFSGVIVFLLLNGFYLIGAFPPRVDNC